MQIKTIGVTWSYMNWLMIKRDYDVNMEIIAHRGIHGESVKQNSIQAIRNAMHENADGVEFDVRLSSDGVCVLAHDSKIHGGSHVSNSTHKELADNHQIATLEEVLIELKDYRGLINIEIKHLIFEKAFQRGKDCVKEVSNILINVHGSLDQVPSNILISSFSYRNMKETQKVMDSVSRAYLVPHVLSVFYNRSRARRIKAKAIHLSSSQAKIFGKSFVEKVHSSGMKIRCYTVNDEKTHDSLKSIDIDGIFSDEVELLRSN